MNIWEFNQLANYNSEVARGILHAPEWKARMAGLQAVFDAEMKANPFGEHSWSEGCRQPWYRRLFG